jgi:hypothetical protein
MVVHVCRSSYGGRVKWEDQGPGQPKQKARPYLQNNQSKRSGGMALMVECLERKEGRKGGRRGGRKEGRKEKERKEGRKKGRKFVRGIPEFVKRLLISESQNFQWKLLSLN